MDRSSYICDPLVCMVLPGPVHGGNGSGVCWHETLWRRLAWQYGESRAATIMCDQDLKTEKDKAAWRRL